jgi:hypothetical protein
MVLFEEGATGESILSAQSNLCADLMAHQAYNLINMYCYTEDGEEDGESTSTSVESKSLGKRITDKIRAILKSISDMITIFKRNFSKNKLTASEYMNSETAKLELQINVQAMEKEVDEEYLAARKIVSKISDITHFPAKDVAAFCDNMEERFHKNRDKLVPIGKAVVSTAVIESARKKAYKAIDGSSMFVKKTDALLDEYEEVERKLTGRQSLKGERAYKAARLNQKGLRGDVYRGLTRLSTTMHKMVKGFTTMSSTLESEVGRAMKKH